MARGAFFYLLLAAATGSGVVAGLFFAFSNFVMQGLGRIAPAQGIAAMQSINITVQNPIFFLVFFGTALLSLALLGLGYLRWGEPGILFVIAGSVLYLLGAIAVTVFANVPLNRALAAIDPNAAQSAAFWSDYLSRWMMWNHVRFTTSLLAMLAFVLGLAAG
jgi:uncharacterized membrane protein